MFGTIKKNWYKINNDVEYSTNFRFFYENQMFTSQEPHEFIIKVISRLDGKVLGIIEANKHNGEIDDFDLTQRLKDIHSNLIEGKVYKEKGAFVN